MTTMCASAADLPSRAPAPAYVPPAPIFTWTGFYVGAYAGGNFDGRATASFPTGVSTRATRDGVVGGGLAGYNYQFGRLVVGVEGDVGYSGARGTVRFPNGVDAFRDETNGYVARVRGRAGFAAGNFGFGDTLLFVAGGGTFTRDRETFSGTAFGGLQTVTSNRNGFNIGGGAEVALTSHIIGRVEYTYDDLGRSNIGLPNGAVSSSKITDNTVRAALEYKF